MAKEKKISLIADRVICNNLILTQLTNYINNNPDIRFSQALLNLGIVVQQKVYEDEWLNVTNAWEDDYYVEPDVIINRMSKG